MKIAFFVNSFPVVSETFILNQIVALVKDGHHVDIFAFHKSNDKVVHDAVKKYDLLNMTTYLDSLPLSRFSKLSLFFSKLIRNVKSENLLLFFYYLNYIVTYKKRFVSFYSVIHFLDKPKYDVIHAHYGFSGKKVNDLKSIGLFRNTKMLTTFHGYDFNVEDGFYEKLFKTGDLFTVNTKYSCGKLISLGCDESKIRVLPVGFDDDLFLNVSRNNKPENDVFTIIFTGRLYSIKAPDFFIEVCHLLREKHRIDFKALIIGDGEMRESLEGMIKERGLDEQVYMLGYLSQHEVYEKLMQSDVFVLTGRDINGIAETQGLVVQEAQAVGLPVVVSDIGGIAEGILPGKTGFAIKGHDSVSFAEKLAWLHSHPDERKNMGQKASDFSWSKYSSEKLKTRLVQFYQDLI